MYYWFIVLLCYLKIELKILETHNDELFKFVKNYLSKVIVQ